MASEKLLRFARAAARSAAVWRPLRLAESIVFGGVTREKLLSRLILELQRSKFRRAWIWADDAHRPHFSDHRATWLKAGLGTHTGGVIAFMRGYSVLEILRSGDVLLDIGCGDGFFARRFYAPLCAHVDAIDVDTSAIRAARRWNSGGNVTYFNVDACKDPLPRANYDVVVLDGVAGHLSQNALAILLRRVATVLGENGVFCGSESLGKEGHDHLQFFDSLDALRSMLQPYFEYVQVKELQYRIGHRRPCLRREALWRCANARHRLEAVAWA